MVELLLVGALVLALVWFFIPHAPTWRANVVRRVTAQERVVALTFDDGPAPLWTPALLDLLARQQVRATFFLMGKRVQQHPALAQKIWQSGHEVGNHSWSHRVMGLKSKRVLWEEIERTDALLRELGYTKEILFRAPFGLQFVRLPHLLAGFGKKHILFDVLAWDWLRPGAKFIAWNILKFARPGSIILLHDGAGNKEDTVAAADAIITRLKAQGYRFVTVSELLAYDTHRPDFAFREKLRSLIRLRRAG